MGAIQEWMDAQDPIVKYFSPVPILMILSSEIMSEAFPQARHRFNPTHQFPIPSDSAWFEMYQSPDKANDNLKAFSVAIFGAELVDSVLSSHAVLQKIQELNSRGISPESLPPEEVQQALQAFRIIIPLATKMANEWITEGKVKTSCKESVAKLFAEKPIESSYFLFVHVPCFFTYQMLPTQLYSQARLGDFEALKKLLSLDRLLFQDITMGKWINEYSFKSPNKFKKLQRAAYAPPNKKNPSSILLSVLRFISAFFTSINKPLTAQDLLNLLAAIDEEAGTKFHAQIIKESRHAPEKDARSLGKELQPGRNLFRGHFTPDIKK